jgi:hypothetical protein
MGCGSGFSEVIGCLANNIFVFGLCQEHMFYFLNIFRIIFILKRDLSSCCCFDACVQEAETRYIPQINFKNNKKRVDNIRKNI